MKQFVSTIIGTEKHTEAKKLQILGWWKKRLL